jgi:DNA-binding response OmpR family regulator
VICLKSLKIGGDIPAVLLIDDEQMILMMLKMGLETYGYQVEIAASG